MADDMTRVRMTVNGEDVAVDVPAGESLLRVLRDRLDLRGVRTGCGMGDCGACTVSVEGRAVRSCSAAVDSVAGCSVTTPEGLGSPEDPHAIQQAFLDEQAAQCGYCINGIVMTTYTLLSAKDPVTPDAVTDALGRHLCRCGVQVRVRRVIDRLLGHETSTDAEVLAAGDGASASAQRLSWQPGGAVEATGRARTAELENAPDLESWIGLLPDGRVEVRSGKSELGQGILLALGQVAAAQLGVSTDLVVVRGPDTLRSPEQGYTAGSRSLYEGGLAVAVAAVALRRRLLGRAAVVLGASVDDMTISSDGEVRSTVPGAGSITFAELAARGPVTGVIESTDHPRWHGAPLGETVLRPDLPAKLTGAPAYVHDLRLPGMLHARAVLPPTYEAELERLDAQRAESMPGVVAVVRDGRLVVVVAEGETQAAAAADALRVRAQWRTSRLDFDGDVTATLRERSQRPQVGRQDPGVDAALEAGRTLEATFTKPYQVHGAVAPSCAVAAVSEDGLTVWSHTQGVYPLRAELAVLFGEDVERIRVVHADGPGCYGHNGADDAAALAAVAARAVGGRPVRFQFSTQEEFGWEPYGTAMVADLRAALDDTGRVTAWRIRSRTDTHSARPRGQGDRLMVSWLREGGVRRPWSGPSGGGTRNIVPLYDFPAVEAVAEHVRAPLRTGSLRSLSAFMYVFAIESFMDELAEVAGSDPLSFRLAHLHDERARAVLEAATDVAGWSHQSGRRGGGQGMAVARYDNRMAYVAVVADVDVDGETGGIDVGRLVVACDAGVVVNDDGLRNQLEGGALQGLSRTLYEELQVDERGVHSLDWSTYPTLGFADAPALEVVLLDRVGHPPLGAGEAVTPCVPAAVANGVDDAIGLRLRDLPCTTQRARSRLLEMSELEMRRLRLG